MFLKGAGDIRRIRMYSQRTGESLDAIYYVDGKYIPEVLNEITYFMRDWRQNKMMKYDARNIDNLLSRTVLLRLLCSVALLGFVLRDLTLLGTGGFSGDNAVGGLDNVSNCLTLLRQHLRANEWQEVCQYSDDDKED